MPSMEDPLIKKRKTIEEEVAAIRKAHRNRLCTCSLTSLCVLWREGATCMGCAHRASAALPWAGMEGLVCVEGAVWVVN